MNGGERPGNPFLLPAATTSRFILLVTIVLAAAASSFDLVAGGASQWRAAYAPCDLAADAAARTGGQDARTLAAGYLGCLRAVGLERAAVALGAMLVVAAAIVLLYLVRPRLTIARQHLVPAGEELSGLVAGLAAEEGLRRTPEVLLDANRGTPGGRAFGRYPRYYLRLNIGTLHEAGRRGDRSDLKAIVLHELAHLRNRDVDLTNLTLSAVWVFAVLVGAPLLIHTAITDPVRLAPLSIRTLLGTVLVVLLAASVLRAREHYADVRAAMSGGMPVDSWGDVKGSLVRLLRLHPRAADRAEVVRQPGRLLRWMPGEALGAGIAAGLVLPHLMEFVSLWLSNVDQLAYQVSALLAGLPVAAILLAGAFRATLAAMAAGRPAPRGVAAGVALAAGVVLGLLGAPSRMRLSWAESIAAAPVAAAVMAGFLLVLCVAFVRWLSACADAWLPVARSRTLVPVYLGALAPATLLFGSFLGVWVMSAAIGLETRATGTAVWAMLVSVFDSGRLTVLLLAALYPLGSWLLYTSRARGRRLYLDSPLEFALPAARVRPLVALAPAAVLTALVVAAELATPEPMLLSLIAGFDPGVRTDSLGDMMAVAAAIIVVMGLLQATTAVVVSAFTGRGLGASHAVLSAVAGGLACSVAIVWEPLARTCSTGECVATDLLSQFTALCIGVLGFGVPVSLLGAGAVSGVRALVALASPAPVRPLVRPARAWLRRTLAVAALGASVLWVAGMAPAWLLQYGFADSRQNSTFDSPGNAVPPPGPPGTVADREACAAMASASLAPIVGDGFYATWATAFVRLGASRSPFLVTLGRAGYADARATQYRLRDFTTPLNAYCVRVR
ncbi:M48 family metalloprotease [Nonomuraea endophytica]|uniref:Zn-dependent protease with chaperone function n=1 Tax=Nonomuraea endophytica TaxID=714136 RepID=A0A7W8AFN3_9ACTN|nr:M48 family metalloprotease [Nonomuraea endophytica]MBB5084186.1 Zn-dependent protease with chaperone function [Nonomuraea endophytica]